MKSFFKLIRKILIILIVLIILVISFITFRGYNMYKDALKETNLETKMNYIKDNTKYYVSYEDIPQDYINALVAVEDHRFFDHKGIDFIGLSRAIFVDITSKSLTQGGSTITQQLAKNMYFTQNRKLNRKIAEVFMASYLEKTISKEKILELYVNTAYYGNGYYGLGQASKGYFKKDPKDLSLYEATLLAGIPNAPSIYAPTANLDLCIQRQKQVINAMVKYKYIDESTANTIKEEQPNF